jgi:hypothetical protein
MSPQKNDTKSCFVIFFVNIIRPKYKWQIQDSPMQVSNISAYSNYNVHENFKKKREEGLIVISIQNPQELINFFLQFQDTAVKSNSKEQLLKLQVNLPELWKESIKVDATYLIVAVDTSGSMSGSPITQVKLSGRHNISYSGCRHKWLHEWKSNYSGKFIW